MRPVRRLRLLLGLWGTYWAGLAAVALGPLVLAILRATGGPDNTGSVTGSFSNTTLSVVVTRQGQVLYSASAHLLSIALWIAGPPLLIWLAMMLTARRDAAEVSRAGS